MGRDNYGLHGPFDGRIGLPIGHPEIYWRDGVMLCVNDLTLFLHEFQKTFPLRQFELNVV